MKPYAPDRRHATCGAYFVVAPTRYDVLAARPTKQAAGMAYTAARVAKSRQPRGALKGDALALSVFGTLDLLRRPIARACRDRSPGGAPALVGKIELAPSARSRLATLRLALSRRRARAALFRRDALATV